MKVVISHKCNMYEHTAIFSCYQLTMNMLFAFLADYHDNVSFVDFILIPIVHIHISTYQRFQYILTYKM